MLVIPNCSYLSGSVVQTPIFLAAGAKVQNSLDMQFCEDSVIHFLGCGHVCVGIGNSLRMLKNNWH